MSGCENKQTAGWWCWWGWWELPINGDEPERKLSDSDDSLPQTTNGSAPGDWNPFTMKEICGGNLEFAVEFAHDENLKSHENVSHLSEFLALLTLKTAEEQTEDFHILHKKLMQLKLESHQLDANFHSPDYYAQREELIFKVVCEIKGIDHDKWLRDEQGFGDPVAPLGDFLQDEFVCDDYENA